LARGCGCVVLAERHVPKTGGSSVRFALRAAEAQGWCAYWGYAPTDEAWDRVLGVLRSRAHGAHGASRGDLRLCIEVHGIFGARFRGSYANRPPTASGLPPPSFSRIRFDLFHELRAGAGRGRPV
jgi:hypothetical protein